MTLAEVRALLQALRDASPEEQRRIIWSMSARDVIALDADFESWAHEAQLPPSGETWRVWLMMAGRGFGKTRAGAEWIDRTASSRPGVRIALVGATIDEARRVMVEGVSGILSVARRRGTKVKWEPALGRLKWRNGSEAQLFSGDNPEGSGGRNTKLRGALAVLDTVVAAAVEEAARDEPPEEPSAGDCFLVGGAPTGEWSPYPHHIAAFSAAGWRFVAPVPGLRVLLKNSGVSAAYVDGGWQVGNLRGTRVLVDGVQVVGSRAPAIADPTGGTSVDAEARSAVSGILSALRQHGLIAEA